LAGANLSCANTVGTEIVQIYVPGASRRTDALYARIEADGLWYVWAGCYPHHTLDEFEEKVRAEKGNDALYLLIIALLRQIRERTK
jgi:hypothetical protein